MPPAARITDMHVCPMVTPGVPPVPHVGGPISMGCPQVMIGFMPAARVGDTAICVGPPDAIAMGSLGVVIGGMPAARMGDLCVHGGMVAMGFPQVIIGDMGSGGAAGGGGGLFGGGALGAILGGVLAGLKNIFAPTYPRTVLDANGNVVTQYNEAITIVGTPEYQAKVLADLQRIANTPTGKALLDSIASSGKHVTIQAPSDPNAGNSCGSYDNAAGRFSNPDGTPGDGSNSTVEYNPDRTKIGDEPWETRPPGVGLAHELIHADQAAHGTMTPGTTNNDAKPDPSDPTKTDQVNTREAEAVGIPPNDNRDYTENKIRSEWDPPQPERQWY